jgi:hypothetical protein
MRRTVQNSGGFVCGGHFKLRVIQKHDLSVRAAKDNALAQQGHYIRLQNTVTY